MHSTKHVLDNPAWHALLSGNRELAQGNETVKCFPKEVSPFVGLKENTKENFETLYRITSFDRTVAVFSVDDLSLPSSWGVLQHLKGFQMIFHGFPLPASQDEEVVSLTDEHIPQMLALTALTNPGPFSSRTIDFGNYEGTFKEDRLVAMAGQRLHGYNYVEISAVCTHPNYVGNGYARQLLLRQIHRIQAERCIPFLHVKKENSRAISMYKNLGFETRTEISIFVLQKKE